MFCHNSTILLSLLQYLPLFGAVFFHILLRFSAHNRRFLPLFFFLLQEWRERREKAKEKMSRFEDPMVLDLCGVLFPDGNCSKSIWSGPHSLVQAQRTTRSSSVHAAIDLLMK